MNKPNKPTKRHRVKGAKNKTLGKNQRLIMNALIDGAKTANILSGTVYLYEDEIERSADRLIRRGLLRESGLIFYELTVEGRDSI